MTSTTTNNHPLLDLERTRGGPSSTSGPRVTDWRQPVGAIAFVLAFVSFLVGWFQIANTENEWEQLPYLASAGGIGMLALGVAITLFVSVEHTRDREAVADLVGQLERLSDKLDALDDFVRSESR